MMFNPVSGGGVGGGSGGALSLQEAYDGGSIILTTIADGAMTVNRTANDSISTMIIDKSPTTSQSGSALTVSSGVNLTGPTLEVIGNVSASVSVYSPLYYVDAAEQHGVAKGSGNRLSLFVSGLTRLSMIASQIQFSPLGTEGAPGLIIGNDLDTGTWAPAANFLAISTGGSEAVRWTDAQDQINTGDITAGGQVFAPQGTGGNPGFSFTGATGFGLTRDGTGLITYMVASGQSIIGVAAAGVTINKNMVVAGSINPSASDTWNIGATNAHYASVNTKDLSFKEQASSPSFAGSFGYLWVKTAVPNTLWFTDDVGAEWQLSGLGADGSTLDSSYDYAGAGAGRAITADAGAVTITNPNDDAANVLELTTTASGTGSALSITNAGDGPAITVSNGQVLISASASNGAPSLSFPGDTNTGIYRSGLGTLTIVSFGTQAAHFVPNTVRVSSVSGSEAVLQIASQGDTNTGHFWAGSDVIGIATGATEAIRWDSSQNTIIPQSSRFILDTDLDTFITSNGSDDSISFFTGGSVRFTVASSIVSCIPAFSVKIGSAAGPGLRNNSDADTGLYFPIVGSMGATASGVLRQEWTSSPTGIPVSSIYRTAINSEVIGTDLNNVALNLWNPTAATDSQDQNSPAFMLSGSIWDSSANDVNWSMQLVTANAGEGYDTAFVLSSQDSLGWVDMLTIKSARNTGSSSGAYFNTGVKPQSDNAFDLGSAANSWRNLYLDDSFIHGASGGLAFFGVSVVGQSAAYTRAATVVASRALLASASATATNNNNVIAAIIADLQSVGLFGV